MTRFKEEIITNVLRYLDVPGGAVDISELVGNNQVTDATRKFIVLRNKIPLAFVLVSSSHNPQAIKSGYEKAKSFAHKIGPPYSSNVALPFFLGEYEGLSYSISHYYKTFSRNKLLAFMQRRYVWKALLLWINGIALSTRYMPNESECLEMFKKNMQALLMAPGVKFTHQEIIKNAISDIDDLKWRPELVCAHNDLWAGNVMLSYESRFMLIDWDGSIERGYPFYDLIRALASFRLGYKKTREAIVQYCDLMQCDYKQAQYYLLLAFAYLYQNLGAWPYDRFLDAMDSSMDLLINHQ